MTTATTPSAERAPPGGGGSGPPLKPERSDHGDLDVAAHRGRTTAPRGPSNVSTPDSSPHSGPVAAPQRPHRRRRWSAALEQGRLAGGRLRRRRPAGRPGGRLDREARRAAVGMREVRPHAHAERAGPAVDAASREPTGASARDRPGTARQHQSGPTSRSTPPDASRTGTLVPACAGRRPRPRRPAPPGLRRGAARQRRRPPRLRYRPTAAAPPAAAVGLRMPRPTRRSDPCSRLSAMARPWAAPCRVRP